jgi:hypothetical protein
VLKFLEKTYVALGMKIIISREEWMDQETELISNVLVLDGNEDAYGVLKVFCQENQLVGLRASSESVHDVMASNIYFGAILISEEPPISEDLNSFDLAYQIYLQRPDLPIFLRRYDSSDLEDIPAKYQKIFTGAYCLSNLERLKNLVHDQIFNAFYPADLVNGMRDISMVCVENSFIDVEVHSDTPFLVRDKLMEDFNTLIALESKWCRGYMMLQASKQSVVNFINAGRTQVKASDINDQDSNTLISNLTNEIWGAIRREFMGYGNELGADVSRTQVPIFINPDNRYISFGASKPQLCYRYHITDRNGVLEPVVITHKLIFNLDWSPEYYEESEKTVDEFIETGDLEMF